MSNAYQSRGVSASKTDVHNAIKNVDKGIFPGAFCKIIEDPSDKDYCALMHADGAGTKSSLAYMYYKETGDESVFEDIAQDSLIMNIDDLLCVGAGTSEGDSFIVSNTIGRNAHRIPGSIISRVINGNNTAEVTLLSSNTSNIKQVAIEKKIMANIPFRAGTLQIPAIS